MKVQELTQQWEAHASGQISDTQYHIQLQIEDAAKIAALIDMYPKRNAETLIRELLNAALSEFEGSLPYIKGSRIIARDEMGDPMYEDVGPTPRYLKLTRQHLKKMQPKPDANSEQYFCYYGS